MKKYFGFSSWAVMVTLLLVRSVFATNVCGNISGIWNAAGSPYLVTCDVTVPAGQTLEIQPGVTIQFQGAYAFTVCGKVLAIGTETDSIRFTSTITTGSERWKGFRVESATDTAQLAYCRIDHAYWPSSVSSTEGGGITAISSRIVIKHCLVTSNATARNGSGICGR